MAKGNRSIKKTQRATFHRAMYPGVAFCEACFCHHDLPGCPTYGVAPSAPTYEMVDMLGTWRKIETLRKAA